MNQLKLKIIRFFVFSSIFICYVLLNLYFVKYLLFKTTINDIWQFERNFRMILNVLGDPSGNVNGRNNNMRN